MNKVMTATPEQKNASNPKASVWVSANAGSGKTHVLVDRVIRLMLDGVNPATILCITYTKAAAAEMAVRVHERLGEWVGISDEDLTHRLISMGSTDVNPAILARARRLFTAALETPGGFKIQTIHAFCERILHLFPVEAGLSPGFEVLDERETSEFLAAARNSVLSDAEGSGESPLSAAFQLISKHVQADAFDTLLESLLRQRRSLQALLGQYSSLANIAAALKQQLAIDVEETAETIAAQFLDVDQGIISRALPVLAEASTDKDRKMAALLRVLSQEKNILKIEEAVRDGLLLSSRDGFKKITSLSSADTNKKIPWFVEWLSEFYDQATQTIIKLDNLTRVDATIALLTLSFAIITAFEETKKKHGAYDFDDLILRTRDLLSDRQAAQWVLYKLDRGFEHVLVDEAQDTSLAQWQIVDALTQEFFSGSGARETAIRTLFVVGDRKQSIFGFQGADPAAFEFSRTKFRQQIVDVDQPFNDVELTISYRTTEQVLKTVDAVFTKGNLARVGLAGDGDTVLHHETNRRGIPGLFELWPLVLPPEKDDPQPWQAPVNRDPATSPSRLLARKIASEIKSWIGKRHIVGLNRVVRPGDILILFRKRNPLLAPVISELRKLGVPVAGADRLKLAQNIAVMDILALIRFVLLPTDDYSLACVLKSPLVPKSLSEKQLFALAYDREKQSLWSRLEHASDVDCVAAFGLLKTWWELGGQARPYEFMSAVLTKTRKAILARLGSEAGDALNGLLESALSFEEQHSTSLSAFANWFLADDEAEIKRDMESGHGEVRLMTVHGAKGLESSIVIMPDTASPPSERNASSLTYIETEEGQPKLPLWRLSKLTTFETLQRLKSEKSETEHEEYRRQLYVAMTRARDELYVLGYQGKSALKDESWYRMVEEALKSPDNKNAELRSVIAADGSEFFRFGPDPQWSDVAETTEDKKQEMPSWLTALPTHPDLVEKNWTATRQVKADRAIRSPQGINRGRVIHKILQDIPGKTPEQARIYAHTLLDKNQLDTNLADKILHLAYHAEFQEFFGADSKSEVTLGTIQPNGKRFTGRVDRLVERPDELLILDFKTDRFVPDRLASDHSYISQLAAYALASRQVFRNKPVRAAILWTQSPRLDWIDAETLKKGMAAIT
jgi:ATP-dependent helicase/nuclease subunit A